MKSIFKLFIFMPYLMLSLTEAAGAVKPNVVLILTDDQDSTTMPFMPYTQMLLAREGMSFEQHHLNASLCCPSRTTFLTGMYAFNHNVRTNVLPTGNPPGSTGGSVFGGWYSFSRPDRDNRPHTLGPWLKTEGYTTGLIGKLVNGHGESLGSSTPLPGWDTYIAGGGPMHWQYGIRLFPNGTVKQYRPEEYGGDVTVNLATDFITRSIDDPAHKPFFLYFAPSAPHVRNNWPRFPFLTEEQNNRRVIGAQRHLNLFRNLKVPRDPAFLETDRTDKVLAWKFIAASEIKSLDEEQRFRVQALQAIDEGVGKIYDLLRAKGQLDNTYVVFTSDNGYVMGQHHEANTKNVHFDNSMRVPFIIRGPNVEPATVNTYLTVNADFAPTLLEWSGATPSRPCDGRSLASLLSPATRPSPNSWRHSIPIAHHWENDNPAKRVNTYPAWFGVRTQKYTYIEYDIPGNPAELYDNLVDPYQLNNLVRSPAKPTALINTLSRKTRELKTCKATECISLENESIE